MKDWMKYQVLYKLEKWGYKDCNKKGGRGANRKRMEQAAVRVVCYDNGLRGPKGYSQVKKWVKQQEQSDSNGCPAPLHNKEYKPGRKVLTDEIEENTAEKTVVFDSWKKAAWIALGTLIAVTLLSILLDVLVMAFSVQ